MKTIKDGYYLYVNKTKHSPKRKEVLEVRNGILYTHYSNCIDHYNNDCHRQISCHKDYFIKNPRKFGPVKAAMNWWKENEKNIIKFTEEQMFLYFL